jgi:hypothetical protein
MLAAHVPPLRLSCMLAAHVPPLRLHPTSWFNALLACSPTASCMGPIRERTGGVHPFVVSWLSRFPLARSDTWSTPHRLQMHPEDGPPLPVVQRVCRSLQSPLFLSLHVIHLAGLHLRVCRCLRALHTAEGAAKCNHRHPFVCCSNTRSPCCFVVSSVT